METYMITSSEKMKINYWFFVSSAIHFCQMCDGCFGQLVECFRFKEHNNQSGFDDVYRVYAVYNCLTWWYSESNVASKLFGMCESMLWSNFF